VRYNRRHGAILAILRTPVSRVKGGGWKSNHVSMGAVPSVMPAYGRILRPPPSAQDTGVLRMAKMSPWRIVTHGGMSTTHQRIIPNQNFAHECTRICPLLSYGMSELHKRTLIMREWDRPDVVPNGF